MQYQSYLGGSWLCKKLAKDEPESEPANEPEKTMFFALTFFSDTMWHSLSREMDSQISSKLLILMVLSWQEVKET